MKTLTVFLFTSLVTLAVFAAEKSNCGSAKITYKTGKENNVLEVEICKNEYGQFYAKKCSDGCDFAKSLKEKKDAEVEDAIVGSPGGQLCKQLGFQSYIVEVDFKGAKTQNVDLCFTNDKSGFVSTGFLRDLQGDGE